MCVVIQYACKLTISSNLFTRWRCCSDITISSYLFARWHLFGHVDYLRHQQQVDLWPFNLESGVRVTCDVGYLCANFSLPRPLCSWVRPDVHNRQTDRHQTSEKKHRLMPQPYGGGCIIIILQNDKTECLCTQELYCIFPGLSCDSHRTQTFGDGSSGTFMVVLHARCCCLCQTNNTEPL